MQVIYPEMTGEEENLNVFLLLRCNTTTQAVAVTGIGVDTDILLHGIITSKTNLIFIISLRRMLPAPIFLL